MDAYEMSINEVRRYLSYFISTIKGDINKLISIAEEGEKEYLKRQQESHSSNYSTTTIAPHTLEFHFKTQPARCTIPLAMTCFSTIEILGAFLKDKPSKSDFYENMSCFFRYINVSISHEEKKVLRSIYRNGLMHSFFPNSYKFSIAYDSKYQNIDVLLLQENERIILNVNRLTNLVLLAFTKIFSDESKLRSLGKNIKHIEKTNTNNERVTDAINSFILSKKM